MYELETQTTESAAKYTSVQIPGTVERYVADSIVPIGHETRQMDIFPISGRNGGSVWGTGRNIFDPSTATDGKYINQNLVEVSRDDLGHSAMVKMKPSTSYCMTGYAGQNIYSVLALDANKNVITWYGAASKTAPFVFTTPANCAYAYIQYLLAQKDTISVYESTTVGDFIPYTGASYHSDFPSTVYGGTIDYVNGVLTADMVIRTFASLATDKGWNKLPDVN